MISTYFQPSSARASATLVTVTIDPTEEEARSTGDSAPDALSASSGSIPTPSANSSSNLTSATSSARSSSQNQPVNASDAQSSVLAGNVASELPLASNPTSSAANDSIVPTDLVGYEKPESASAEHNQNTLTQNQLATSTPASLATDPSSPRTTQEIPLKDNKGQEGTGLVSPTPVSATPTSSDHDKRATIVDYSASPNSSSNAAVNGSRARRRAAVFQKASNRFDEPSGGAAPSSSVEESILAAESSVNIWDEPKEDHIIFEKPAASPVSPLGSSTPNLQSNSSNRLLGPMVGTPDAGMRETVVLGENHETSSPASSSASIPSSARQEVVAGTLNQLVKHLTSSKGVDGHVLQTFLLTYTSFATPKVLLEKLIQRYDIPKHKLLPKTPRSETDVVKSAKEIEASCRQKHLRVVNFARKWLDLCFMDLTEEVIEMVFQFTEKLKTDGATSLATLIDNSLSSKLAGLAKRKMTQFELAPPPPIIPKNRVGTVSLEFMDIDPTELARQITLIDYELFGQIRSMELLNQSWNKPKLKHRSPHVLEMIQRFNTLSKWLCGQILRAESLKDRIKVMQNVVKLGRALLQLNNFNALNAVLSALQNSAVFRLNQTKEGMGSKYLKLIEEWSTLMAPRQNSANYKAALAAAQAPAVPYLGYYLSALTFIEEGNPAILHGLINFKKCRLMSKVIVGLLQYQVGKRYNLVPIESIKELITNLAPTESDDDLYELSLVREPRVAQAAW